MFLSGFYYSQKKFACGGLLLFTKIRKLKFGPSGGRFFNKNADFALKLELPGAPNWGGGGGDTSPPLAHLA